MRDGLTDKRVGTCHVPLILGCAQRQVNEERTCRSDKTRLPQPWVLTSQPVNDKEPGPAADTRERSEAGSPAGEQWEPVD